MTASTVGPAAGTQREGDKRARLRRMRQLATSLLVLMLGLLAASTLLEPRYPFLQWLRAFSEAAVVGAIADWFAVVALFRHPLGLPIPHTAIIPRKKDEIGASLGDFVEHNFLTPDNVIERLADVNLAGAGARWLIEPRNGEQAARALCALVPRVIEMVDDDDVRSFFERSVLPQLEDVDLARVAGQVLEIVTEGGHHEALLDRALKEVESLVSAHRDLILHKFGDASKYTPAFVDAYIVNRFVAGMIQLLHDVADDADHPLRLRFAEGIRELVEKLKTSPELRERGERIKAQIIEHLRTEPYYRRLWTRLKQRLGADIGSPHSRLQAYARTALTALGNGLLQDRVMQQRLNSWALKVAETLMLAHRHQVSLLITDIVKSWDAKEVSKKLELEIGKDLQYIRVNGTLVGGAVGVALHALTLLVLH